MQDKITITLGNETKTFKMFYGLLDELAKNVGDIDGVGEMLTDADLRNACLKSILAERDDEGNPQPMNLFYLDISPEDVNLLLAWAQEHVLDFFLKYLEKTAQLGEQNKARVMALMPSSSGGED